jgi:hypothetical protein
MKESLDKEMNNMIDCNKLNAFPVGIGSANKLETPAKDTNLLKKEIEDILEFLSIEETKYRVEVDNSTVATTIKNIEKVHGTNYVAKNIVGKEIVIHLLTLLFESKLIGEREEGAKGLANYIIKKHPEKDMFIYDLLCDYFNLKSKSGEDIK